MSVIGCLVISGQTKRYQDQIDQLDAGKQHQQSTLTVEQQIALEEYRAAPAGSGQ